MADASAVFVGDGSLLIQCAQAWRQRGHEIRAVLTSSRNVLDWAAAEGLPAVAALDESPIVVPGAPFDYLFSIANLRVLPAELLARARRLAINFHDGPLPRYAGLNATSWALMAQEDMHGITWHEMTPAVDAGRIVKRAVFPLEPEETALGLNARCYEVGLAAFHEIAEDIARGELRLSVQETGRSYFARDLRPDALGTLDFSRPAAELAALVRALDFGPYPNPLGLAKVHAGDRLVYVRAARVPESASGAAPGTVLGTEGAEVLVATGRGDIALSGVSDAHEQAADHLFVAGTVLAPLDATLREKLAACTAQTARGEASWRRSFGSLSPVDLPYPRSTAGAQDAQPLRIRVRASAAGATTVAAFFAWLSALSGQEQVSALYCDRALSQQAEGIEAWLSPWVPLTLDTHPESTAQQATANAETGIASLRQAGAHAQDLPLRLGDKVHAIERVRRIGICLCAAATPPGTELLLTQEAQGPGLQLVADGAVYTSATLQVMATHLAAWLRAFDNARGRIAGIPLLPAAEAQAVAAANATTTFFDADCCVHEAISAQVARTPQQEAIRGQGQVLTYGELDARAAALAGALARRGVRAGDVVGVCLERTPEMVVALLAIMKAGAAYLPLDPAYPRDRIAFMIEDSAAPLVVTTAPIATSLRLPASKSFLFDGPLLAGPVTAEFPAPTPDSAAYLIYTSGSTGRPKGVVVTHRNVMNLFAGMADRIPHEPPGRWLAVTSLSFDISVLELFWTLAQGFTVVMHSDTVQGESRSPEFSLFYFATDNARDPKDRYKLLLEGAKFADREGFAAIWTPERHFHAFGGLYPNPAVTSAAIAAITTRLQIRAGSCVLPLHHPIRVAEEWAFVDNISQGRIGVSFASGWQPNDFVIAPQAFAERKNEMLKNVDVVRRLWRGEAVTFPGPLGKPVDIRTLPRPVQAELPVWLTAAGNPETFQQAGEMGCHLLTHLLGQKIEDVAEKLKLYRAAWRKAGHAGHGHVTLMLHTFVGADDDEVRETVRGPMKEYLRSSLDLIKQAAWSFPTFVQRGAEHGKTPVEIMDSRPLSEDEMDALLEHAFSRYYGTSALFGTPRRCLALVGKLKDAGVDEIACLIDFGVDADAVLTHLADLKQLMVAAQDARPAERRVSIAEEMVEHGITHLQCTPSMASMLVADTQGRAALSQLSALLVGGEALAPKLARELRSLVPDALLNVYGPTETTVWSTTCALEGIGEFVPLGRPIANTQLSVRTPWGQECPALVSGELFIGGEGVTRGYWKRPELTAERFVDDPAQAGARLYRTGDLVRRHPDGAVEFLGRIDHQVKIRGHRIELGEIEAALLRQAGVAQAVVTAAAGDDTGGRLIAYVTASHGEVPDAAQLRSALAEELPAVMVPQHVMVLPALPLTPNGKVDRRALPDPRAAIPVRAAAAPGTTLEKTIASIWAEALGVPGVGITDNFFDLGGHSLLVVQVQRRLHEICGREVSIADMFRLPTVRALAAHLEGNDTATAVADGLNRAKARRMMRTRAGLQPSAAA
jgi:natural product biosynthesis luciferase-like monooxygenase protein